MKEVFEKAILIYGQTAQGGPGMLEIIIAFVKAVGIVLLLSCPIVMWACLVVSGRYDDD